MAVFEEVAEPDKKKGIKSRFLAQVRESVRDRGGNAILHCNTAL